MSILDNLADSIYKRYKPDMDRLEKQIDILAGKLDWIIANLPSPHDSPAGPPVPPPLAGALEGATELIVWDGNTIADEMRAAGFQGRDTLMWYGLANSYTGIDWDLSNADQEVLLMYNRRHEIQNWFGELVNRFRITLQDNPTWTATAIVNDGHDRCGFRIGPAIVDALSEFGDRVRLGEVYRYE